MNFVVKYFQVFTKNPRKIGEKLISTKINLAKVAKSFRKTSQGNAARHKTKCKDKQVQYHNEYFLTRKTPLTE